MTGGMTSGVTYFGIEVGFKVPPGSGSAEMFSVLHISVIIATILAPMYRDLTFCDLAYLEETLFAIYIDLSITYHSDFYISSKIVRVNTPKNRQNEINATYSAYNIFSVI